jgi:Sec-independent protein translocase protein TatA
MYILIILLCITILFRDKKEGFFKSVSKGIRKARRAAGRAAQQALERTRRAAQQALERVRICARILVQHTGVLRDRDMWKRRLHDIENRSAYNDPSFGNNVFFSYYKDDMNLLNRNIDENERLNNELNDILKRTKIFQNKNKVLAEKLKQENTPLKECNMNKELTDNDYNILN